MTRWAVLSILLLLLISPTDTLAQQTAAAAEISASISIIGRWEAQSSELYLLQITAVLPGGRFVGSHRLTDGADGRREYYPFEGIRLPDGKYTYTVYVESGPNLTYMLWQEGNILRGHLIGRPDLTTTFMRQP